MPQLSLLTHQCPKSFLQIILQIRLITNQKFSIECASNIMQNLVFSLGFCNVLQAYREGALFLKQLRDYFCKIFIIPSNYFMNNDIYLKHLFFVIKLMDQQNFITQAQTITQNPEQQDIRIEQQRPRTPTEFDEYFYSRMPSEKIAQVHKKYNHQIQQKLIQKLDEGKINIRKKRKINLDKDPLEQEGEQSKKLLRPNSILEVKNRAKRSLKHIVHEQMEQVKQSNRKSLMLRKEKVKQAYSYVFKTNQGKQESFKKLIFDYRNFKHGIQQKTQKNQSKYIQEQIKDKNQYIEKLESHRHQRRISLQHHIQQIEKSKSKQKERLSNIQNFLDKIRTKKYSHVIISQKEQEKRRIFDQEREQRLKQIKDGHKGRFHPQIWQHQRKYDESCERQKQQTQKKLQTAVLKLKKSKISFESGIYRQQFLEEIRQKQRQEHEKAIKGRQQNKKIKEFDEYVHEKFKPKNKKKRSQSSKQNMAKTIHSLSCRQIRQKGIEYLTFSKETAKNTNPNYTKNGTNFKLPSISTKTQYKNYLRQMSDRKTNTAVKSANEELTVCLRKEVSEGNLWKATMLAQKANVQSKKIGDQKMFEMVRNKLNILSSLD